MGYTTQTTINHDRVVQLQLVFLLWTWRPYHPTILFFPGSLWSDPTNFRLLPPTIFFFNRPPVRLWWWLYPHLHLSSTSFNVVHQFSFHPGYCFVIWVTTRDSLSERSSQFGDNRRLTSQWDVVSVGLDHQESQRCIEWTKRKTEREQDSVNKSVIANTVFTVDGVPLKQVNEFKYLGRILEKNDNNWPAINRNAKRARMAWGWIGRILAIEKADKKVMASIYKAVVQAVLAIWLKVMGFNIRYAAKVRHLSPPVCKVYYMSIHSWKPRWDMDFPTKYAGFRNGGSLLDSGICFTSKNTMKYILTRPIYQKCLASKPLARNVNQSVWWHTPPNRLDPVL
jgi:hypothetical protein